MKSEPPAGAFVLGAVVPLVEEILGTLRLHPEVSRVAVAGGYRRSMETVRELVFLAVTKAPDLVCEDCTTLPQVATIVEGGGTCARVVLNNGMRCEFHAVSNKQFPFALLHLTGSADHLQALHMCASNQGLLLDESGITTRDGSALTSEIHDEADIYHALGLDFIDPELRENRGEIAAAASHTLPKLVELANLRGTFHNHTTDSDGLHTLEEMVDEAIDMGLQYLGISDHSKSTTIANGLDEERLLEQIARIRRLDSLRDGIRIFAGSEVDILRDGRLDFSDDILAKLDFCVASVHDILDLTEDEMTRRICRAMENEHVTMLGHLTGRLLLRRKGYAVDHARIIDCAAATRTIIELNCSLLRLDMDWRWWQQARDKGVLCSINPDAHSIARLHHIGLGVRAARKGWLRRQDVLNTRPLADVEAFFRTPKAAR